MFVPNYTLFPTFILKMQDLEEELRREENTGAFLRLRIYVCTFMYQRSIN